MQFGVNLLPRKQAATLAEKEFRRKIRILIGVVLAVYTTLIAALFATSVYISSSQKKLSSEIKQTELQIESFKKKETLALTLKQRMEFIGEILATREQAQNRQISQEQLLSWIGSLVFPGIALKEVSLSTGEVAFLGEAENALVLGEFLEQFQSLKKKISYLTLDSLNRSAKGIYSFSFKVYLF